MAPCGDKWLVTHDGASLFSYIFGVLKSFLLPIIFSLGAGKSTLSRLLLRMSINSHLEENSNKSIDDAMIPDGTLLVTPSASNARIRRGGISWVSTELHLHAAHNWGHRTVLDILTLGASFMFNADKNNDPASRGDYVGNTVVDLDIAMTAMSWLGLPDKKYHKSDYRDITTHPTLSQQFCTLSQGEQKLLLVASAIAQRPNLLVLDEPCQGLDLVLTDN